jgi:hypothetical protein
MLVFPRRIEHPLDVTVQGFHDVGAGEHRRPVLFGDEQQRLHRGLPFVGVFGDVFCGVAARQPRFRSGTMIGSKNRRFTKVTPPREQAPCPN